MFNKKNFGSNISFIEANEYTSLNIGRIETCLGRKEPHALYDQRLFNGLLDAKAKNIPRSIHLPILRESYEGCDYLDAFFLDDDLLKREWSFESLERNVVEGLKYEPEYFVLHFQGVYKNVQPSEWIIKNVMLALERIDAIAAKYETRILVEYFGSHFGWYEPKQWVKAIGAFDNIGLLVDTCHLKFACIMHEMDYYVSLEVLLTIAEACHIWTAKGLGAYRDNETYMKYHHIEPSLDQREEDGWAFTTTLVLALLKEKNIPVLVEAVPLYSTVENYKKNIREVGAYLIGE